MLKRGDVVEYVFSKNPSAHGALAVVLDVSTERILNGFEQPDYAVTVQWILPKGALETFGKTNWRLACWRKLGHLENFDLLEK